MLRQDIQAAFHWVLCYELRMLARPAHHKTIDERLCPREGREAETLNFALGRGRQGVQPKTLAQFCRLRSKQSWLPFDHGLIRRAVHKRCSV